MRSQSNAARIFKANPTLMPLKDSRRWRRSPRRLEIGIERHVQL